MTQLSTGPARRRERCGRPAAYRAGLLVALALALAACSSPSESPGGGSAQPGASDGNSGPVVTISPGGAPNSLCDLLTPADFDSLAGVKASAPTSEGTTATEAYCVYGTDIEVDVFVAASAMDAHQTYLTVIKEGPLNAVQANLLGGVDESVYGTLPKSVGLSLRRNKLVIAIELPKSAQQEGHVKMIKLAGQLLQRAGSLGT